MTLQLLALGVTLVLLVMTVRFARSDRQPATGPAAPRVLTPVDVKERERIGAALADVEQASSRIEGAIRDIGSSIDSWSGTIVHAARTLNQLRPAATATETLPPAEASTVEFADRRVAKPLAEVSLDMIVQAPRLPIKAPALSGTQTLGFTPDRPVTVFMPTLPRDPSLAWRQAVAVEDSLATKLVMRAVLDSWPGVDLRTLIVDPDSDWRPQDGNVCAICREHRNPMTTALLSHLREKTGRTIGFFPKARDAAGNPTEWGVSIGGEVRVSPSYEQERELEAQSVLVDERVELRDLAVAIHLDNPWDTEVPQSKALVVAGVRAFGTWGVANYLRTRFDTLYDRFGDKRFACLFEVRRKYRVGRADTVVLYPADHDGVPTAELIDWDPLD